MLTNCLRLNKTQAFFDKYAFISIVVASKDLYGNRLFWMDRIFANVMAALPKKYNRDLKGQEWILMCRRSHKQSLVHNLEKQKRELIKIQNSYKGIPSDPDIAALMARAVHCEERDRKDLFSKDLVLCLGRVKKSGVVEYSRLEFESFQGSPVATIPAAKAIKGSSDKVKRDWTSNRRPFYLNVGNRMEKTDDGDQFFVPGLPDADPNSKIYYLHPPYMAAKASPLPFLDISHPKRKEMTDSMSLLHSLSGSRAMIIQEEIEKINHRFKTEGAFLEYEDFGDTIKRLTDKESKAKADETFRTEYSKAGNIFVSEMFKMLNNNPIWLAGACSAPLDTWPAEDLQTYLDRFISGSKKSFEKKNKFIPSKSAQKESVPNLERLRIAANNNEVTGEHPLVIRLLKEDLSNQKGTTDLRDPYLQAPDHWITQHISIETISDKKSDDPENPAIIKCFMELLFKKALRDNFCPAATSIKSLHDKGQIVWFAQQYAPCGKEARTGINALRIDFRTGEMKGIISEDESLFPVPIVNACSGKEDRIIYNESSGDIFMIEDTAITPLPDRKKLLEFVNNGNCNIRKNANYGLINKILDISFWINQANQTGVYLCGPREENFGQKVSKAPHLRIVHSNNISAFVDYLPLMLTHQITSDEKFTCYPYPFKYLREQEKLEKARIRKNKLIQLTQDPE